MDLATIGAALAVIPCLGAGISIGMATSKACEATARQPEAADKIMKTLVFGCALAEATAIYGLLVGLMCIFFK